MDVFDTEPYSGLVPRRWLRVAACAELLAITFATPAREWWFDQAERHLHHEMQPLIDRLIQQTEPSAPSSSHPLPAAD